MLLGLDEAWKVTVVKLELEAKQVVIRLEHGGGPVTCPECGSACPRHDLAPERTWRHLDTMHSHKWGRSSHLTLHRASGCLDTSMARALRIEYPGAVYHVMARGDGGKRIFRGWFAGERQPAR